MNKTKRYARIRKGIMWAKIDIEDGTDLGSLATFKDPLAYDAWWRTIYNDMARSWRKLATYTKEQPFGNPEQFKGEAK